jgi:hypothetical protein
VQAAPPATPVAGDLWFNSNNLQLYAWYDDGTSKQWVSISQVGPKGNPGTQGIQGSIGPAGPTGAKGDKGVKGDTKVVIVQAAPPATPVVGDLWFNSNNLQLYAWYDDGTSKQWVSISQTGPKGEAQKVFMQATPPSTPVAGDLWFNTNNSHLYTWYDDGSSKQWVSISQTGPKGDAQRVFMQATPPATPVVGDLWFNSNNLQLYAWYDDGSSKQWVSISKAGPQGAPGIQGLKGADSTVPGPAGAKGDKGNPQKVTMSATPPATPVAGDLWFNSNNLQLYAWYDDGSSKQWASISQAGPKGDAQKVAMSATPPATPVAGDLWFNINRSALYAFYNDGSSSQWVSI